MLLPDVFRVTAAQEECGTVIGCVKLRETHEVHQVIGNGLQINSPGIVSVLLYQISEEEMPDRVLLCISTQTRDLKMCTCSLPNMHE